MRVQYSEILCYDALGKASFLIDVQENAHSCAFCCRSSSTKQVHAEERALAAQVRSMWGTASG